MCGVRRRERDDLGRYGTLGAELLGDDAKHRPEHPRVALTLGVDVVEARNLAATLTQQRAPGQDLDRGVLGLEKPAQRRVRAAGAWTTIAWDFPNKERDRDVR